MAAATSKDYDLSETYTMPDGNTTIYAFWKANYYDVVYDEGTAGAKCRQYAC